MALPTEPVSLSPEQIAELHRKLSAFRHDLNNNLSLIAAAAELLRHQPQNGEALLATLTEQPQKVAAALITFSRELEAALRITRP